MRSYFQKFRGEHAPLAAKANIKEIAFAWGGGFIAIALIGFLTQSLEYPLILGSFGASCVLLFGFPKSPFSQPRNVIAGHFLSTLIGLIFFHLIGDMWWSMALALATALAVMLATNTVHPPAGSNPIIVFLLGAPWTFLITPTLIGAVILVIVALFYLNLKKSLVYPSYWV
ncbi:HPP family protein [Sulfuricurvum sp.]|uniref:HPP family protein n=1 Tax=Sulfuricurvum sp. TaxID=2025608 RepID=UPI003566940C